MHKSKKICWEDKNTTHKGGRTLLNKLLEQQPLHKSQHDQIVGLAALFEQRHRQKRDIRMYVLNYDVKDPVVKAPPDSGARKSCDGFSNEEDLRYARVPLGVILRGSLRVHEDDKEVRLLGPGDLIGLYETCYWLAHVKGSAAGKGGELIGHWSVNAVTDSEVLFLGKGVLTADNSLDEEFRDFLLEAARRSLNPRPVSRLPVLDQIVRQIAWPEKIGHSALVCRIHLLQSAEGLLEHLARLFGGNNLFILEKSYSTIPGVRDFCEATLRATVVRESRAAAGSYGEAADEAITQLWGRLRDRRGTLDGDKCYRRLVVLDDGGELIASVPWSELDGVQVTAVEQTSSGIWRLRELRKNGARIPFTVNVALCRAKQHGESPFIAQAIYQKLLSLGVLDKREKTGILGLGNIGRALADILRRNCYSVVGYDVDRSRLHAFDGPTSAIRRESSKVAA